MKIVPVVLSGGAGTRLWPLSRQAFPKPFIVLPQGDTLIRRTYKRAAALGNTGHVVTVTNRELVHLTMDEYRAADQSGLRNTYLLEPFARNTAAAIALATLHLAETEGPDTIILALPADHLVADEAALQRAVMEGAAMAARGRIAAFGIAPTRPETGFGYIEAFGEDVFGFVEKPDAATAAAYVETDRFWWNSGIFCFTAATMLKAMEEFCAAVLEGAKVALSLSAVMTGKDCVSLEVDAATFAATPAISVDYAVMEKVQNLAFVACDCGWSDIGSWAVMAEQVEPDGDGNRVVGEAAIKDARNCFVQAPDRLVGLVGVEDLMVIDTPDALLVAHRDSAQQVRTICERLWKSGHAAASQHRTAHRPWGSYTVLEQGPRFKIKRLEVKPGASLSLQAHHHRSEHWVVVSGTAAVVNGDCEFLLTCDQSTYIPCGNRHRLGNPGKIPLVVIEVQSGDYLDEDDIIRFEDAYGRVEAKACEPANDRKPETTVDFRLGFGLV